MKLTYEQLQSAVLGAVRMEQQADGVHFFRFTKEQEELYKENPSAFSRCMATAGVRLRFKTTSCTMGLEFNVEKKTSRSYFSVDVVVNGNLLGSLDNVGDTVLQGDPAQERPLGHFNATFALGEGEKDVCVHFPWSVCAALEELTLDDDATFIPVKPQKRVLVLGDSITQGYDALRPSGRYAAIMCDRLGAEEINKGIGAEYFFPPLAATKDDFTPDLITVAYGTNDWGAYTEEVFCENCRSFFESLRASYPSSPIVAFTPIWRKNHTEKRIFGDFARVGECIHEQTAHIENLVVVDGYDFIPHDEVYFADLYLHPNDKGFAHYAEGVCRALAALPLNLHVGE